MPLNLQNKHYQSYGFLFKGKHQENIVGLYTLGWEHVTSHSYNWDGLLREEKGKYVFQYTLAGGGAIEVGDKQYSLHAGDAFLVEIPSKHRYYLPETSDQWEFIYITLFGAEAQKAFQLIHKKIGPIIQLTPDSDLIKLWFTIFDDVANKKVNDSYQASALGYTFMMELYRFSQNITTSSDKWPGTVAKAIVFAQNNYNEQIGLDDMVTVSGLSKYHFTRLFQRVTNHSPIQYLTRVRIDKAVELLRFTNKSIEEIAIEVGYANGNYFSKVFYKRVGMSPSRFRESKNTVPVDYLMID